jgi:sRNA-binding protein
VLKGRRVPMKRIFLLLASGIFIFSLVSCGKAKTQAQNKSQSQASSEVKLAAVEEEAMDKEKDEGPQYVAGEILIKFKPEVNIEDIPKIIKEEYKCEILDIIKGLEVYRLKIPAGKKVKEMVEILSRDPRVKYAEPNIIYRLQQ